MEPETRTDREVQIDAAVKAKNFSKALEDELAKIGLDVTDLLVTLERAISESVRRQLD